MTESPGPQTPPEVSKAPSVKAAGSTPSTPPIEHIPVPEERKGKPTVMEIECVPKPRQNKAECVAVLELVLLSPFRNNPVY